MIGNLIRKDFLLVKKTLAGFLGLGLLILLLVTFLLRNTPQVQGMGLILFLYFLVLMELSFIQAVATEEEKSPKATALLCAAPYPRKSYVMAKYLCYLICYAVCGVVYSIVAAVHPQFNYLNITEALISFLVGAILYGVYTPVAIKYGLTKARIVFIAAVFLISLGPTLVVQVFRPDMKLLLSLLQTQSSAIVPIVFGVAGVGVFLVSMIISIRIFEKKEL